MSGYQRYHRAKLLEAMNRFLKEDISDPSSESRNDNITSKWNLEVIDGYLGYSDDIFAMILEKAPRLKAFIGLWIPNLTVLPSKAENLTAIYMEHDDSSRYLPCTWAAVHLPRLTALRLRPLGMEIQLDQWKLPALRHLSIEPLIDGSPMDKVVSYFMQIVDAFGRQLITFYYGRFRVGFEPPQGFWSCLPRLQRIQLPYWRCQGPPLDHPIHHVRVSIDHFLEPNVNHSSAGQGFPYWERQLLQNSQPNRPLTVQLDYSWLYIIAKPQRKGVRKRMLNLVAFYDERGTVFTDSAGLTFHEYLVFAIRVYWKEGHANHSKRRRVRVFNPEMIF